LEQLLLVVEEQQADRRPGATHAGALEQFQHARDRRARPEDVAAVRLQVPLVVHAPEQLEVERDGERPRHVASKTAMSQPVDGGPPQGQTPREGN
jgi:hypothetical protein